MFTDRSVFYMNYIWTIAPIILLLFFILLCLNYLSYRYGKIRKVIIISSIVLCILSLIIGVILVFFSATATGSGTGLGTPGFGLGLYATLAFFISIGIINSLPILFPMVVFSKFRLKYIVLLWLLSISIIGILGLSKIIYYIYYGLATIIYTGPYYLFRLFR